MQTFAQSNARVKTIFPTNDTISIDSLSIIPGSEKVTVFFNGTVLSQQVYETEIDYYNALLIIKNDLLPDSIIITYQVFPYFLAKEYFHKDPGRLKEADIKFEPYTIDVSNASPYLDIQGLDYNGSLTRGISFGNNQDVVVNSTFNLQMNGKLQNDVEVTASITESNIPIQPEGNTQQLQEFDKVFIRLSKDQQALTMGDFEIYKPDSYFLNFYKKSQGGLYEGSFNNVLNGTYKTNISLAASKGIYTRQDVAILEGNQGPYKLRGVNNETFIIILAGTERVFIDGKLLVRGAENDYVIDYNAAEITFTTNQLLTKDKRVNIEFEYSDKNYFRTLAYWKNNYTTADNKLNVRLNIYSEQDSKNQPVDQTLDSLGRSVLENAGDSVQNAFVSSVDTIAFDAGRIMYALIDTLGFDSVFVYSTDPESALYVLVFTELGINRGNYVQETTTANGRVYKWVAPVSGIPQGSAEPVILLVAPKKNQMLTLGGDYQINEFNRISGEIAYSNADVNTFSEIDNNDNRGIATVTKYQNIFSPDSAVTINSNFSYEFADKNFVPVERYRPLEFNRDWNILSFEKTNEHYTTADFNLTGIKNVNIGINSTSFIREKYYTGFRQGLTADYVSSKWITRVGGSYLVSSADTINTRFLRPAVEITKIFASLHSWQTGIIYEGEHNRIFKQADSVITGSFFYNQYQFFIRNADTAVNQFGIDVIMRDDALPDSGKYVDITRGITYSVNGALNKSEVSKFSWQLSYRTLEILDTSLTTLEPENTLLGRLQHSLVIKKGFLTSDIFYEIGTGQEPRREYTFVEVEPGLGIYTWNDYNANGIPELNEFEISVFADEANYIQVYVPTDEYVQSNTANFNYALNVNPKAIWFDKTGMKKFVARFASQSSLQLNKKVIDEEGSYAGYNPFATIDDSSLVSSNIYWQNTVFFNRTSSVFGMDYSFQKNFNKSLIINGPESRGKDEHRINARYKIATPFTVNLSFIAGTKDLISIAFPDKNYRIPYNTIEPKLNFIKGSLLRISTFYQYTNSRNAEGGETLFSHEATLDVRYNVVSKSTISSNISYIIIDFSGVEESPVGYAMLEGLQNGNNILWNVNFDRKLSQVLQMNIAYEGRKTGDAAITHVGRLQMRAIF
ncbi:MAG: hypothetical protein H7X71_06750 [Chitinophagales bacterium]|nr:hypothetical protein [Chitinophagales bacterium]